MKNYLHKSKWSNLNVGFLTFILLYTFFSNTAVGQVRVPFAPRTSVYTPGKTTYNIKGDFTMIGNTNLTLEDYADDKNNSNNISIYVDKDLDPTTLNSSSAYLSFATQDGGATIYPECSNIVYAGLYWTGRAGSDMTFDVTKEVETGNYTISPVTENDRIYNSQTIPNTNYTLNITRTGNYNNRVITYSFTSTIPSDPSYDFIYRHNSGDQTLHVKVNGGSETLLLDDNVSGDDIDSDDAYPDPPYVLFDNFISGTSGYKLELYRLERDGRNSDETSPTSAYVTVTYNEQVPEVITTTKTFDKRKVKFKVPGGSYVELTANSNNIYYPPSTPANDGNTYNDGYMYSGYIEVTNLLKQLNNPNGNYFVADVATLEGDGGSTGYYGGWGLVVVYENSKMKWRDITVFDGHAYVVGNSTVSHTLDVSGFNAVQSGDVNIKMGFMAGEGDVGIDGDYFQIQKNSDNSYMSLSHTGNSSSNFFNSSVETGGNSRDPNLQNNTGLDISMFNVPNSNNEVIANSQTSTRFRYGSTQDTYVIFSIVFAVDAYIPEPEGLVAMTAISSNPSPAPVEVEPGEEIDYKVEIRNKGSEAITNYRLVIPIPYTTTFVNGSISFNEYNPLTGASTPYFDASEGANGAIIWEISQLPEPTDPETLLGELHFSLAATTDCALLLNNNCAQSVDITGSMSGTGAESNVNFEQEIIQGHLSEAGNCEGEPVPAPLIITINGSNYVNTHCTDYSAVRTFDFCDVTSIDVSEVEGYFPPACIFYNEFPFDENSTVYNAGNPFPGQTGTYFAVPPGQDQCYFEFTIRVDENCCTESVTATVNSPVCEGEDIDLYATFSGTPVSISWSGPDGYSSTDLNPAAFASTNNSSGEYIVTVNYNSGCEAKDTVQVTVNNTSVGQETHDGCEGDGYEVTVNNTLYNEANPTGTEVLTNSVGCDSTVTINLVYKPTSVGQETHDGCEGDGYEVTVNNTLYNEANPTGTEVLTNSVGCDSTVTINLVYKPTSVGQETHDGCEGDGYEVTVNNTLYNEANPTGTEVLTNSVGCDSTVTINLVYKPTSVGQETHDGCEGDGYEVTVNNTLYNEANPTGTEVLTNSVGCDSTVTINLVYKPTSVGQETHDGCEGDGYEVTVNNTLYNEANPTGTEVLTNSVGCDSTVTINLVYKPTSVGQETHDGCEGDGYEVTVNNTLYNEANPTGTEVLTNSVGCDSTVTINLVYKPTSVGQETHDGCEGDGYEVTVNNTLYNEANPTGTEVLTNSVGCDSTVTINLVYKPTSVGQETHDGCEGDGYEVTVNNTLYNEANPTGTEVLTNSVGCDSTVTINLVYKPTSVGQETHDGCEGDGYEVTVNNTLYNEANPTGTEVLTNSVGCDSTVTINLVYKPTSVGQETHDGCEGDGYEVTVNNTLYNEANPTGTEVLTNSVGCDSTVTINLVYKPTSVGQETHDGCEGDGYEVTVNNTLYNEANPTGTEVLTNSVGCDSTVTINLVYKPTSVGQETHDGCEGDGYEVTVNNTLYNEANPTGTEVLTNSVGCDSTVTINLVYKPTSVGQETHDGCEGDGYEVTVNNTLYNEANPTGTEVLTNSVGCDSTVTINLVYKPTSVGQETHDGCEGDGYEVTVNNTLYNEANPTGTEVLTNSVGCDSTVTINLVYKPTSVGQETHDGCEGDGYEVTVNNTLYNEANPTGTEVLTNSVGCDSTVTINLVYKPTSVGQETHDGCEGDGYEVTVNNTLYNEANPTGTEVLTNSVGCDSTVTINLVYKPTSVGQETHDGCEGDGYEVTVNNTLYNEANPTGTEVLTNSVGCDSTVTINLVYKPTSVGQETHDGCEGDGYEVTVNNTLYNEANPTGTEVLTNSVGCDSTVTINLVYKPTSVGQETHDGCEGDGYEVTVNNTLYNEANPTGTEVLTNSVGCDSTVTINLVYKPTSVGQETHDGCEGDGYEVTVNNTLYNEANPTGTEVLTNSVGCDSTVTINLVYKPTSVGQETHDGCEGDGYEVTVNNTLYNEANPTGTEVLTNSVGCDSTVTINLVYKPTSVGQETHDGCEGDGYEVTVNNTLYNEANPTGTEVLTNSVGCDSTVTINLVYKPTSVGQETHDGCEGDGYEVTVNNTLYNEANPTGTEVLTNSVGCDSTVTINLVYKPTSVGQETHDGCEGDGYEVTVNNTLYNEANPTGTEVLTNSVGCDSTVTINLVYKPTSVGQETHDGCEGDGYEVTVNNTLYNEANPTGTEVLTNSVGCDSTVTINLVYKPTSVGQETHDGCEGDGYEVTVNNTLYNEANPTGTEVLTNSVGCDSTVTINLVYKPTSVGQETHDGCEGDGYEVTVNNTLYNEANPTGTEVLTNSVGCDSTVTINLVYKPTSVGQETHDGCEGDGYEVTVNNTLYNEANPTGTEVLTNSVGCDSTVTINLVYKPTSVGQETHDGCEGDGYEVTVNNTLYNEANPTGTEVLTNSVGCDSTVTINLVYKPTSVGQETHDGCEGDGYEVTVNNTLYNEANPTGTEVLTNSVGCDSTVTINLVYKPTSVGQETHDGCEGDGYEVTVNNTLYNEANPTGTEVLTNSVGCDSTVTINLVYKPTSVGQETHDGCEGDGYEVTVNNTLYNEANPTGTEVLTNSVGCDSTVTINLVYKPTSVGQETHDGCEGDGYEVTVNNTLYNEANPTGTEVLTNSVGCDSTVTINLVYKPTSVGQETHDGCEGDGYEVTVNNTLYNEANPTGTEVLTNSVGCDSTVTINLVYKPTSVGQETHDGCEGDGYEVTVNNTLYNEANPTGTEVLTNSVGCDSTVTINLVYKPTSVGQETHDGCEGDGYEVTVNNTLYNEANPTGTEVLTNSVGCDSTVTINLVYKPTSVGQETHDGCEGDGYEVTVNNTLYNEANPTGTEVLTNSVGCDSTVTINLVYKPTSVGQETHDGCEGDGYEVTVNNTLYNEANPTGTEVLTNSVGCDSTVTINLVYKPTSVGQETHDGCEGDGYEVTVNNTLYNEANPTGTEVLTNSVGCDSTVTINLVYKPTSVGQETHDGCEGDGYEVTVNNTLYNEANPTGTEVLTNSVGCDSTVTINLVYKPTSEIVIDTIVCDSLVLNGVTYTTSGTKEQHFTNAIGCDSMLTINLTVLESTFETINRTVCDQFTINNSTYTQSGQYIQHLTNAAGCDSTLTINLTVNESSELTLNETHCDSYELNGITYTESGTYTIRSENESGCTLIITLNLTILDPVELTSDASDLTVECDGNGNLEDLNNWLETIGATGAAQVGFGTVTWTNDFEALTPGCCNTGSVLVTFIAYDECQNSVSTSATFTIVDSEAPAFTAPEDITIYSGEECQYDSSVEATGDVTDESDACCPELDATYTDVVEQGACAGEWVITRTWNLADACGNQAEPQVQIITVMDTVAPVAVCNNITIQLGSNGIASITADDLNGGSTDNCGIDTVFISQYDFTCGDLGTNEVTLTVVDNCGNTSTCSAEVTVEAGDVDCGQEKLIAQPDVLTLVVCPGGIVNGSINLLTNDEGIGTSGITMSADNIPDNVQVNLIDGELLYANEELSEGVIQFTYTICSNANPENCSTAEVTIHIQLDTDCDGVPDVIDIDDDDDGILDIHEEANALNQQTLDSDGDGIVDRLDIDSDNDGIPDNIEWQQTIAEGQEADRRGRPEENQVDWDYYPPLGTDSNGNGWDDQYDDLGVYYEPIDMDLDGIPDYLDEDSDGDGIADYIEGWDATPHDTIADVDYIGSDLDGDGLDDAYDSYDTSEEWLHGQNAIGSSAPLQDSDTIIGVRDWRDIYVPSIGGGGGEAEGCELFIPNGFSPNGDTYNDYFEIIFTCETGDKLFEAEYPDAKIEIFNRWGNKVYEKANYGNTQRWSYQDAWWDGKSTNKMQVGRDNLPTATYFYILYLGDGSKPITGSIFLNN